MYECTSVQVYKLQSCKVAKCTSYKVTKLQSNKVTMLQGCKVTKLQSYKVARGRQPGLRNLASIAGVDSNITGTLKVRTGAGGGSTVTTYSAMWRDNGVS